MGQAPPRRVFENPSGEAETVLGATCGCSGLLEKRSPPRSEQTLVLTSPPVLPRVARVTATGSCGHGPKLSSAPQGPQPLPAEARGWRLD